MKPLSTTPRKFRQMSTDGTRTQAARQRAQQRTAQRADKRARQLAAATMAVAR
jgi:hypothetical protein